MTKEEKAIMYFKDMRKKFCEDYLLSIPKNSVAYKATMAEKEFYDTAIQVLEQEPCEDVISRQAVLDIIRFEDKWLLDAKGHNADTEIAFNGMKSKVADLPSVKPQESKTEQFAEWVAREIFDDMWEYNKDAFAELACRKLEKLGIVRAKGDEWELVDLPESEEV